MSNSFADSGEIYTPLQARVYQDGTLHVQGKGVDGNRSYGIAVNLQTTDELREWFNNQSHGNISLSSGSSARYVAVQARNYGDGRVHFQAAGDPLNREYGVAFEVTNFGLAEFVERNVPQTYDSEVAQLVNEG